MARTASVPSTLPDPSTVVRDAAGSLRESHGTLRLALYAFLAATAAVLVAGFWNYHVVDGFGRDIIAGRTIGDTSILAGSFAEYGTAFGFVFAMIAGLAATFTACNCVVFAMLPGLACSTDRRSRVDSPWWGLAAFVGGVTAVSVLYGAYIGWIGPDGVAALNVREVRLAQAQTIFTLLGGIMLVWGLAEMGFLDAPMRRLPAGVRGVLGSVVTKAATIGVLVGLFAVGRPFPVFREFLTYAAQAESPTYGAAVMAIQGIGQILVMIVLFALLVWLGGRKLLEWSHRSPTGPRLLSGLALVAGGAFFVFYWGLAFAFDVGRWGFKLGWY